MEAEVSKIWFNDWCALPNHISFNFSPFKKEGVTLEITITDWAEIHQVVSTLVSGIFLLVFLQSSVSAMIVTFFYDVMVVQEKFQ